MCPHRTGPDDEAIQILSAYQIVEKIVGALISFRRET
jgi:hypothetical protein